MGTFCPPWWGNPPGTFCPRSVSVLAQSLIRQFLEFSVIMFPTDPTLTKIIGKDLTRLLQSFLLETDRGYMNFRACALVKISENIAEGCSQVTLWKFNFWEFDPSWIPRLAQDLSKWGYFIQTCDGGALFMKVWWSRELWKQDSVDFREWLKNREGDFSDDECESV